MARIRTIKPELWTDERLTECSLSARLMFIGMLNFADDNGNMAYSAKRLKMQIFPADAVDTQPLLDELIIHGLLIEYSVNDEKFLHIKGFKKHQVINRPSHSSIPQPPFITDSLNTHGALTEGKERKGREGNKEANASVGKPTVPNAPVQNIVDLYNEILTELPAVKMVTDKRKRETPKFWRWVMTSNRVDGTRRAETAMQGLEFIRSYFERAKENDFVMGRTPKAKGHEGWEAGFDYLISEPGRIQVVEKTR